MKNVLIIGNNWPEPSSTAAGLRMMQLIEILLLTDQFSIHFCSAIPASERSSDLSGIPIHTHLIELNNSSFDLFIASLQPVIVIYDRFYIEEQYGWRVHEVCPNAITILDTEDLHFLRKARQRAVNNKESFSNSYFNHADTYREIASILRCTMSLIISEHEMDLLKHEFHIDTNRLFYLPFLRKNIDAPTTDQKFETTADFLSIGNFMHAPNEDAVWQLKKYIWPKIRKQLPKAQLHIYGSYCQEKHFNWHNEKQGFLVHGAIEEAQEAFKDKRVLLAPLRYGAGLKGKIFEAMIYGVPVCTSNIGAEGMYGHKAANGLIAVDNNDFVVKAIQLYTDKELWLRSLKNAQITLVERFDFSAFAKAFTNKINELINNTDLNEITFEQQLLNYHSFRHLKFKSKWIEEKERNKLS